MSKWLDEKELEIKTGTKITTIRSYTVAADLGQCQLCWFEGNRRPNKRCYCRPECNVREMMGRYLANTSEVMDVIFIEVGVNEVTNLFIQPHQKKEDHMSDYQKRMLTLVALRLVMLAKEYILVAKQVVIIKTMPRRDNDFRQILSEYLNQCFDRACEMAEEPRICTEKLDLENDTEEPETMNLQLFGKRNREIKTRPDQHQEGRLDMIHLRGRLGCLRFNEEAVKLVERIKSKIRLAKGEENPTSEIPEETRGVMAWHYKANSAPPQGLRKKGTNNISDISEGDDLRHPTQLTQPMEQEEVIEIEVVTID